MCFVFRASLREQSYNEKMNIYPSNMLINVNKSLKRKYLSKNYKLYQNCKLCTNRGILCNLHQDGKHKKGTRAPIIKKSK